MNRKIKPFYIIIIVLWLFIVGYLIINEEWLSLIKNVLMFIISFIGGSIYSMVARSDK